MYKRSMLKNPQQERRLFQKRLLFVVILLSALSSIICIRLAYLQLVAHRLYTTLSINNQQHLIPIAPNRGLIFDRNGVLLAANRPGYSLDLIPDHIHSLQRTINNLKQIINISDEDVDYFKKSLRQHRRFEPTPLKLKLTEAEVATFYANQFHFPGVTITTRLLRYYPLGAITSNILGYVGRINTKDLTRIDSENYRASTYIGKVGIEKYYENKLHGKIGYQRVEIDASGRIIRTLDRTQPNPGNNLYLTIDSTLQAAAQKALGNEDGAVVAIAPKSGEILALANHPSYDPNLFVNGISKTDYQLLQHSSEKPLYNRAIRGQYPMGSTIKPFLALQGLETHTITPNTTINDPGIFIIPKTKHLYHDWKPWGHGAVNLRTAIIVSCDTYFYQLAYKLGMHNIVSILHQFGFGRETGVDIGEELPGLVPTPEWKRQVKYTAWYSGDTILSGIGQGYLLATPLQLANATAIIANHGIEQQPHLVNGWETAKQQVEMKQPITYVAVTLHQAQAWKKVIEAMRGVISSRHPLGTGHRFGNPSQYTVAAKTGTSQVYLPHRFAGLPDAERPKRYRNHSLFIAFAPVDHPRIAVAVVAEHSPSAPAIARKVIDFYLEKRTHGTH